MKRGVNNFGAEERRDHRLRNDKPDLESGFFSLMLISIISAMSLKKLCRSTILSWARSCESMVGRLKMSYTFLR